MKLAHKIEIKPNKIQEQKLLQACGCARFAYNWALAKWQAMYDSWKLDNSLPKPNANIIKKEFNLIKEKQFPWIYDSPKDAMRQELHKFILLEGSKYAKILYFTTMVCLVKISCDRTQKEETNVEKETGSAL